MNENEETAKKAVESAGLALWQAYCEKKEELEDAQCLIESLQNEIANLKLELATRRAYETCCLDDYQFGLNRG